jgi:hypothetical protein
MPIGRPSLQVGSPVMRLGLPEPANAISRESIAAPEGALRFIGDSIATPETASSMSRDPKRASVDRSRISRDPPRIRPRCNELILANYADAQSRTVKISGRPHANGWAGAKLSS